jgi:hypothetical protein
MKFKSASPASVAAFKSKVTQLAERIRVRPRQVRLQRMRRKWASCSTRGTVSFSTEVLTQPAAFQEYVIVHELLHLKVANHGKLFKTLLRAYIPDFENIRPRHANPADFDALLDKVPDVPPIPGDEL